MSDKMRDSVSGRENTLKVIAHRQTLVEGESTEREIDLNLVELGLTYSKTTNSESPTTNSESPTWKKFTILFSIILSVLTLLIILLIITISSTDIWLLQNNGIGLMEKSKALVKNNSNKSSTSVLFGRKLTTDDNMCKDDSQTDEYKMRMASN